MVLHIDAYLYQGDEEAFVSIPAGHLAADFNNTGIIIIDGVYTLMIPIQSMFMITMIFILRTGISRNTKMSMTS